MCQYLDPSLSGSSDIWFTWLFIYIVEKGHKLTHEQERQREKRTAEGEKERQREREKRTAEGKKERQRGKNMLDRLFFMYMPHIEFQNSSICSEFHNYQKVLRTDRLTGPNQYALSTSPKLGA